MSYRLIYPTDEVSLADVAKAALAQCGAEGVTVVSGAGSQAVRVPEACADRVEEYARLSQASGHPSPDDDTHATAGPAGGPAPDGDTMPPQRDPEAASGPDETQSTSPDPDAPTPPAPADDTTPGRPAGRAADRPVKRGSRRKEG